MQSQCKGNTLLEALIAVCSVAVGALALTDLQAKLIGSTIAVDQKGYALLLAQNEIESLKQYSTQTEYDAIVDGKDSITNSNTTFSRTWTVSNHTSPTYKKVTVNVSWTLLDGSSNRVDLTGLISYEDISQQAMPFSKE